MGNQRGTFTLVELLIVLAIIGIGITTAAMMGLFDKAKGNETEVTPTPVTIINWFDCSDCTWHTWEVGSSAKPYDISYESIYSKETGTMLWVGVKGNCLPYNCEKEECCPCE